MRKNLLIGVFLIFISFLLFVIAGCRISTSTSFGLKVQQTTLAKILPDGKFSRVTDGIYQRGEKVYLVLLGVGKFKKDKDGLNKFDVSMKVTGPDDKVLVYKKDMLGENGHMNLKDNIATSPHVYFKTTDAMLAGKYKIKMTIYDKVAGGSASESRTFILK